MEAPAAATGPVIRGIQTLNVDLSATRQRTFQIVVETYRHGRLEESADYFERSRANAVLVTNSSPRDDRFLEDRKFSVPVVALNRHIPGIDCVNADYESDGENAAERLLELGTRNSITLRTTMQTQVVIRRRKGFLRALRRAGMTLKDEIVCRENNEFSARDALLEQIGDLSEIDGIYCLEPYLSQGVRAAIGILGLRIPEDIALVGEPASSLALFDRSASFADVPIVQMAYEAARLIHQSLSGNGRQTAVEVLFKDGRKRVLENPPEPGSASAD